MIKKEGIQAHGGDVQFYECTQLPETAQKVDPYIFARGEKSGHCHIATGDVEYYKDGDDMYLVVGSDGAYHQHTYEKDIKDSTWTRNENFSDADHVKPCPIPTGIYKVGIHLAYDPWAKVMEEVYD